MRGLFNILSAPASHGTGLAPILAEATVLHLGIPAQHTAPVKILMATVSLAPIAVHEEIVRNIVVILHRHHPIFTGGPSRLFKKLSRNLLHVLRSFPAALSD